MQRLDYIREIKWYDRNIEQAYNRLDNINILISLATINSAPRYYQEKSEIEKRIEELYKFRDELSNILEVLSRP